MNTTMIVLGIVALLFFYSVSLYNWLQTTLTRINASIQEIGNQLKRQANLIPNLESSAKSYLKHEKDIYKSITDARKAVDNAANSNDVDLINKASDQVSSLIPKLQVLMESNPEIKGEKVVSRLMDELRDTSDKLTYARRVVIDLSADFNQRLVTFPSNVLASMMGFKTQKGLGVASIGSQLDLSEAESKDHKVNLD